MEQPTPPAAGLVRPDPALLWRALAERSGRMVAVCDGQGRFVFVNDRFLDGFGLRDRYRDGARAADLLPAPAASALRGDGPGPAPDGTAEQRLVLDGTERSFLASRFRLPGPNGGWRVWLGLDISRRVRAETDLLASTALFRGILEIAADAIVSVDDTQTIIEFNQGAERIFGYARGEAIGEPLDLLLPEASRRGHCSNVAAFARSPEPARQMGERGSIRGRRKDGTTFTAEASISRVTVGGRRIFTAILRDVTQAREAEAAIRRLNADLAQRAAQLESANRELEAFSYSVSHDLRAPLRSLSGFSQVLMEDYADKLDEDGLDALTRIRDASQRMGVLIDDLLELSRVTRGDIERQRVNLSEVARGVMQELRQTEPGRNVTFLVTDGLLASADPRLMRNALQNLLGNAWKYTSKHESARIEFGVRKDMAREGRVFFVKDDGAGFDMSYAHKLFGAFQRLHGMKEYPGTGIGLATVQRIIHKHGGEIWAEAAVERGATFFFTLPEKRPVQ